MGTSIFETHRNLKKCLFLIYSCRCGQHVFTDNGTTILRFRTGKIPRAAIPGAGVKHSKETQKAHCHFLLDVRHLFLNRVFKFFLLSPKISLCSLLHAIGTMLTSRTSCWNRKVRCAIESLLCDRTKSLCSGRMTNHPQNFRLCFVNGNFQRWQATETCIC